MADQMLVGRNYTTPDLIAKVTGRAKYAEDYRAEGMLFTKLLLSPMPHARVRRIDTSAAQAMAGVRAILTAGDLPDLRGGERALTNEPLYQGEPILAVAALDELTAAEAVERITVDLEPLPFVVDPIESLRPSGANARLDGNVWMTQPPQPGQPARPTNGRTAISRPASSLLRSLSTRRSWCSPRDISRWRRAVRWRTGRAASCTCMRRRRA